MRLETGEDELAVRDFVTDGGGDPFGSLADAALVAGGTEVAALAGEGEEAFVAAVGAVEAEEAGGEVAAAEEVANGGEDVGAEWAEGGAVRSPWGYISQPPSGAGVTLKSPGTKQGVPSNRVKGFQPDAS